MATDCRAFLRLIRGQILRCHDGRIARRACESSHDLFGIVARVEGIRTLRRQFFEKAGEFGILDDSTHRSGPSFAPVQCLCFRKFLPERGHSFQSAVRSEEHTSELQSLMRISYAVFCLKKKKNYKTHTTYKSQRKLTNYNS